MEKPRYLGGQMEQNFTNLGFPEIRWFPLTKSSFGVPGRENGRYKLIWPDLWVQQNLIHGGFPHP